MGGLCAMEKRVGVKKGEGEVSVQNREGGGKGKWMGGLKMCGIE